MKGRKPVWIALMMLIVMMESFVMGMRLVWVEYVRREVILVPRSSVMKGRKPVQIALLMLIVMME
jgi:hypothetical protein